MSRLCERPGCSEPGAVAYGMIPENLLFWIAPIKEAPVDDPPVLCRRHADLMSVPRGWTLDDRRERFPRLFMPRPLPKVAVAVAAPATARPDASASQSSAQPSAKPPTARQGRRRGRADEMPEQLVIDGTGEIERPDPVVEPIDPPEPLTPIADTGLVPVIEPDPEHCFDLDAVAAHDASLPPEIVDQPPAREVSEPAWTPDFDTDDTLNGLLKPKSPLLARAFRGTSRQR
jgi:hypothetical protein